MSPWTAGGIHRVLTAMIPCPAKKVAVVQAANIKSVTPAAVVARPVTIPSVRVVLIPALNVTILFVAIVFLPVTPAVNVAAGPACLIKPVPIVLKN